MRRILFVDDEPNVLDGLRRMFRPQRREWTMTFATSGDEALAAMAADPVDVVVTDMKMPGMSGAELLEQIQEHHPRTVRVVLSGHADMETSMRSVSVSHQFLAKPCDAPTLTKVVNRACDLEELLRDPSLQVAVSSMTELPVIPRVYKALTVALSNDNIDIHEVVGLVERDSGIAAKILQLVNSSFFGIRTEIAALDHAVAYLGVNTIRDLVLSFEMFRQFGDTTMPSGFIIEKEQEHALLTARIASRLLDDKIEREQALLAAMLHDVGKLILATRLAGPFQRVLQAGAGVERPFPVVEEEILGVCHGRVGAYLLGLWGLPYPVVEAVAHHHHPARVSGQTRFGVLAVTHVADSLAREQDGRDPGAIGLDKQYLERLGVLDKLPQWRAIAAEEAGLRCEVGTEDEAA